ncbi:YbfB/YjiJ family MFS transporter [Marinobacterium mangrovicola]|uniref:Putative MFS family arabinose efflux permease n=1 Tax=Marinobacterium mangrovicola TaxID=1476959 RepID=A0A4R1GGJ6_9GAMM|nr:YbfB/YjiJ family MFS transporter [Marinobacterium mangrovicola]TCK06040.1 putative MFS family arabinose efflux permease [Marinobacterium mangrovicola]
MDQRLKVLSAGILSLIVTVGVARFAYTPLLPVMLQQTFLDTSGGGWLASFNYIGYLAGALAAAAVPNLRLKDQLYRLCLVLAVVTTLVMPLSENYLVWSILRLIAGFSAAGGLLLASALILNWLIRHGYRSELGVHFIGMGAGIAFCSVVVELFSALNLDWSQQWTGFALLALLLAVPAWRWMPRPDLSGMTTSGQQLVDQPPSRRFNWLLLAAYFCAGWGYVISATFIVDIVQRQPGLESSGNWVFLVLGLAAAPAVIVWDKVARRTGYVPALLLAYVAQLLGILMPALSPTLAGAMTGAVLFGASFIGAVGLVLTLAGRFYPTKPAKLMGRMTLSYGLAQIIAPAITGTLAERLGNYNLGLYIAAGVVALGAVLMALLWRLEQEEPALQRL